MDFQSSPNAARKVCPGFIALVVNTIWKEKILLRSKCAHYCNTDCGESAFLWLYTLCRCGLSHTAISWPLARKRNGLRDKSLGTEGCGHVLSAALIQKETAQTEISCLKRNHPCHLPRAEECKGTLCVFGTHKEITAVCSPCTVPSVGAAREQHSVSCWAKPGTGMMCQTYRQAPSAQSQGEIQRRTHSHLALLMEGAHWTEIKWNFTLSGYKQGEMHGFIWLRLCVVTGCANITRKCWQSHGRLSILLALTLGAHAKPQDDVHAGEWEFCIRLMCIPASVL